jgi:peptide/nickel transport system ATP-binding protein
MVIPINPRPNLKAAANGRDPILQAQDITVDFKLPSRTLRAVDHVSLDVQRGEILGVVGESGSGKSTLASAMLNIVSAPGVISSGQILFKGQNVLSFSEEELREFRWRDVAMVFQAAQNSLNPVLKIKAQVLDTAEAHGNQSSDVVLKKARELLRYVRLEPDQVLDSYPHQLSGGMKQRTIMALSLLLDPEILILDEPTTALDVITQAYVMNIFKRAHVDLEITMVFLTHDVSIMAKIADRIAVMYAGQVVELGTVDDIFYRPIHAYTKGLINAAPSLTDDVSKRRAIPGSPPDLTNLPSGCRFAPRCRFVEEGACTGELKGELVEVERGHYTTCVEWKKVRG